MTEQELIPPWDELHDRLQRIEQKVDMQAQRLDALTYNTTDEQRIIGSTLGEIGYLIAQVRQLSREKSLQNLRIEEMLTKIVALLEHDDAIIAKLHEVKTQLLTLSNEPNPYDVEQQP